MYEALRPMLAVGDGDLWTMSTLRVRGPATECPQILKRFLEEQRRVMGVDQFRQEHMCEFVGRGLGGVDRELVERMLDDDVEPMDV
jgi:hypothetical protein